MLGGEVASTYDLFSTVNTQKLYCVLQKWHSDIAEIVSLAHG